MKTKHYYLARQPIFDRDLNIVGYELLFRSGPSSPNATLGAPLDPDEMTIRVLEAAENIGWNTVIGDGDAWVNSSYRLIDGVIPINLPPERVVLEVLETVSPTPEVVEGIVAHAIAGRKIALDDFVFGPQADRLLDVSTVVKLDLKMFDPPQFVNRVQLCKDAHLLVLAEKVETPSEYKLCRTLGCDYFQGYYLAHPEILSSQPNPQKNSGGSIQPPPRQSVDNSFITIR